LFSRVTSVAALDELRGFKRKLSYLLYL